ncbi:26806_t:CDS:1, partial [Gigaspora margarita]
MKNSNDISASNISDNTSNSDVAPERIENSSDNTPDSDPYQEKDSRSFTSPIPIGTLSSEEKEINEFLELQEKERVSNREKKICRGQQLVRKTSSSSDTQNAISTEINPIIDHKTTRLESIPTDQAQNTGIKIPYNKRVEQVLRHDLSVFIKENINNKVSEVFDIQIPEFSLEVIITGSSKITAQSIADLFIIAMKVRQKEILCWYCYYKAYEDRIEDIKRINKIDDQSARTLVYNEIKALLPNISDVNLRQRTFRAKKIYTLLMGIGIEKIQAITCSASAISSLTDNQIQDIINCFSKNSNVDDSSVKYQEMIGVTNCNAHVTEPSSSKDVSNIEVRIPTESSHTSNSEDMISEDKSLLETKA